MSFHNWILLQNIKYLKVIIRFIKVIKFWFLLLYCHRTPFNYANTLISHKVINDCIFLQISKLKYQETLQKFIQRVNVIKHNSFVKILPFHRVHFPLILRRDGYWFLLKFSKFLCGFGWGKSNNLLLPPFSEIYWS